MFIAVMSITEYGFELRKDSHQIAASEVTYDIVTSDRFTA